jgi:acetyl-CoA acyltransferase
MYEALGFCEPGKGAELAKSGATGINGTIPVNTGGGLIGFGHPVGATGIKQVLEIFRQMKGLCGDYQIKNKPTVGFTANMGGDDRTTVCMAFRA